MAHIALFVHDCDETLAFYVGKLGFALVEDTHQPAQDRRPSDPNGIASKRWVTMRPPSALAHATTILLARASTDHQANISATRPAAAMPASPAPESNVRLLADQSHDRVAV